jgi:hypothetical protein
MIWIKFIIMILQKFPRARSSNRHCNQATAESRTSQFNRDRSIVGISDGQPHPMACLHSYQMFRLPFLRARRQPPDRSQREA